MARSLRNRTIIITGASSGIGAATALACAAEGMNIVINARRRDRLHDVASRIDAAGGNAHIVAGDVTSGGVNSRLLNECAHVFGGIDIVFANAGYGIDKPVAETTPEDIRAIFEVNLFAALDLLRRAAAHLIERSHTGHLLMCSSCLSKFTMPGYAAYSATKAAQNHFCRAMNIELRRHRIPVSSVNPITTRTEFHQVAARLSGRDPGDVFTPDHAPGIFVQRPERVASAVVRCLRRPKPEVWTSVIVRATAAVGTMFPRFIDAAIRNR